MLNRLKELLLILLISLIPTIIIWLPFFFRIDKVWGIPLPSDGMATVVANYDGPLYIVTAKTLYNKDQIKTYELSEPAEYYAAHFPLYPLLIRSIAQVTGYPYGMLIITLLSSFFALYFFKKFISDYVEEKDVYWFLFVFAIFPARWLIVRSVGSPEPLFVGCIIATVYYFKKEKYLFSGIFGALASVTKSPGILLFIALGLAYFLPLFKRAFTKSSSKWLSEVKPWRFIPLFLIPLASIGVFYFYKITMNDFFAYFHSGDNIHIFFPPFQIFNYSAPWVGTFWLEEVIFVYLFIVLGIFKLVEKRQIILAFFVGVFFASLIFVSHRDILRYALPVVPFLFVAYSDFLKKKESKIIIAFLLIPIYLFSIVYISQNVMQISDWRPLL